MSNAPIDRATKPSWDRDYKDVCDLMDELYRLARIYKSKPLERAAKQVHLFGVEQDWWPK